MAASLQGGGSFGEARLTQSVEERIDAPRLLPDAPVIEPHAGKRCIGINRDQSFRPYSTFFRSPEQAAGRHLHAQRRRKLRLLLQRFVAPRRSLLIAARHEMRVNETE